MKLYCPTRREFLKNTGIGIVGVTMLGWRKHLWAKFLTSIRISHSISTFIHSPHMVAIQKNFFEEEGLEIAQLITPGAGAKVVQVLAARQALFAFGDAVHPLKLISQGKDAAMLFSIDHRCSYANIVVRKKLWEEGLRSIETLGEPKWKNGQKLTIAATALGSGTHMYGQYILKQLKTSDGTPVSDHVEWMAGGDSATMLGGLKAGRFDAIIAVPEWMWSAEAQGIGKVIYDALEDKDWNRIFPPRVPVTVGYALKKTIQDNPEIVQSYVNACYRAHRWIRISSNEEILSLLHKPYMDTFPAEAVLKSIQYYKTIFNWNFLVSKEEYENGMKIWHPQVIEYSIPYDRAVDMSFAKKAQATYGA